MDRYDYEDDRVKGTGRQFSIYDNKAGRSVGSAIAFARDVETAQRIVAALNVLDAIDNLPRTPQIDYARQVVHV